MSESELKNIVDNGRTVTLPTSGKAATVYRCKVKHIALVSEFLRSITDLLNEHYADSGTVLVENAVRDYRLILKLISTVPQELYKVVVPLSSLSQDELENMDIDDFIVLVMAIAGDNYDFFTQNVVPVLQDAMGKAEGKMSTLTQSLMQKAQS